MKRTARSARLLKLVALLGVLAAAAFGALAAFAAPSVPVPTISSAPANPTNQTSATFAFSASGGVTSYECSLDTAAFATCTSPKSYPGPLAAGSHSFQVRAIKSGTGAPGSYSWVVDTTPPAAPAIASAPSNPSDSRSPSFGFTASETGETFLCALDTPTFTACANPAAFSNLAIGTHSLQVKGKDAAGNVSLSATSYAWTIAPPAPTITAKPADPTNLTGASFGFSDSLAGATFVCALDSATFAACTSPKSYPGPLTEGSHTFQVKALSASQQSAPTAYTWRLDLSPPALSVSFPADGGSYNAAGWNAGCVSGPGLCGSAIDASGVAGASLSIQQLSTSKFWNGSSFSSTTETFNAATPTGGSSTSFVGRYPLALPAAGSYRVHVRAADNLGNTTAAAAQTSLTFTIDTAAPPAPAISGQPANPTTADSAPFSFSDSEPGVSFQCKLDGGSYASCSNPQTYTGLALGSHTFSVQAKDAAGNLSAATGVSWTINAGAPFTIHGSVTGLVPGVTTPVPLTISNPNNTPIFVSQLTFTVSTNANSGSCLASSYTVTAWTAPSSASELSVPANATNYAVPVADQPKIKLNDSATANQDNCKGKSFTLTYSGSAHA